MGAKIYNPDGMSELPSKSSKASKSSKQPRGTSEAAGKSVPPARKTVGRKVRKDYGIPRAGEITEVGPVDVARQLAMIFEECQHDNFGVVMDKLTMDTAQQLVEFAGSPVTATMAIAAAAHLKEEASKQEEQGR